MKNQFLLLITLFLSATIVGQNKSPLHLMNDEQFFESAQGPYFADFEQILEERNSSFKKQDFTHFKSEDDLTWNLDSTFLYLWSLDELWEILSKTEKSYDDNGNLILELGLNWDAQNNNWENDWKRTLFYNENGLFDERFNYSWDSEIEDWKVTGKDTNTYEGENLIESNFFQWDSEMSDWVNSTKKLYTYDGNGNLIEIVDSNWDSELTDWSFFRKTVYSYNDSDQLTVSNNFNWDAISEDWVLLSKTEYFYDEDGNRHESIRSIWDAELSTWILNQKVEFTYDENGNLLVGVAYNWDPELTDWVLSVKFEFYWSSIIVGIEENPEEVSFNIYPNPTSGHLILNTQNINGTFTVELLNLNGQIFYSQQLQATGNYFTLDLPDVSKGMYLLKVQGEGFVKTEKLMIK